MAENDLHDELLTKAAGGLESGPKYMMKQRTC